MPDARGSTHLLCGRTHVRREASPDDAIAALAKRQEGIVGRRQLLDLRISSRSIDHRLAAGRLRRRFPGVYAVGHEALTFRAQVVAAVMAVSPGAAASHWTGAALRGLCDSGHPIHVTATQLRRPRPGLVIHRATLPADELMVVDGIPVTTVERTLLDLSAIAETPTLRRLIKQAEFLDRTDAQRLAAVLARHPRRRGRGRLARLVEGYMLGVGKTRAPCTEAEEPVLETGPATARWWPRDGARCGSRGRSSTMRETPSRRTSTRFSTHLPPTRVGSPTREVGEPTQAAGGPGYPGWHSSRSLAELLLQ